MQLSCSPVDSPLVGLQLCLGVAARGRHRRVGGCRRRGEVHGLGFGGLLGCGCHLGRAGEKGERGKEM